MRYKLKTVLYSNTPTTVNSNVYVINGTNNVWAVPAHANTPSSSNSMLVILNGIVQNSTSYTYPSNQLGSRGINIDANLLYSYDTLEIRILEEY